MHVTMSHIITKQNKSNTHLINENSMVVLLKVFFVIKVMSSTGCYGYKLDSGGHVTAAW